MWQLFEIIKCRLILIKLQNFLDIGKKQHILGNLT